MYGGVNSGDHLEADYVSKVAFPLLSRGDLIDMSLPQKEMVEQLKLEWKRLWQERLDDKVRAEGIAAEEYSKLFVDKGLIIHATRDFKALSFKEILEQHQVENAERFIPPSPQVGGWAKFVKTNVTVQRVHRGKRALLYVEPVREKQQLKKGGRGWLHV